MKKSYRWAHPMNYVGNYPDDWAGYTYLQHPTKSGNHHEGVDYNGPGGCDNDKGMALFASANGVLEWWGYHNGWGWHCFIKHDDPEHGTIYSHYAHCLEDSLAVEVGDEVEVGQKIAEVGDSGWNFMCAHVHFEIRKPIGEGYGFWADPNKGWDKEKISEYFFNPYEFIEQRKNREEPETVSLDDFIKLKQEKELVEREYREFREQTAKKEAEYEQNITDIRQTLKESQNLVIDLKTELSGVREERDSYKDRGTLLEEDKKRLEKVVRAQSTKLENEHENYMILANKYENVQGKLNKMVDNMSVLEFIWRKWVR